MDAIGWYIATMHQFLGHDKAAIALDVPTGDKGECLLCIYESNPTANNKQAVENAISRNPNSERKKLKGTSPFSETDKRCHPESSFTVDHSEMIDGRIIDHNRCDQCGQIWRSLFADYNNE